MGAYNLGNLTFGILGGGTQDSSQAMNNGEASGTEKAIVNGVQTQQAANAASTQTGYQQTTAGLGKAATGTSTAAGSAAASHAAIHFYGGETVQQIKSSSQHKVNITGGSDGLKSNGDKSFYKNVTIPRKKV